MTKNERILGIGAIIICLVLIIHSIGGIFIMENIKNLNLVNQILSKEILTLKNDLTKITFLTNDYSQQIDEFAMRTHLNVKELERQTQIIQENIREVDYRKILNGSVVVTCLTSEGSGTVIKKVESGFYVLTCYHVVNGAAKLNEVIGLNIGVSVGYPKYDKNNKIIGKVIYGAKIIKVDEPNDLALLKVEVIDTVLNEIKIANNYPKQGDNVYSVGNPLGLIRTVSKGILANYDNDYYVFDGTITFGNSGGGLYNKDGELIGVPTAVLMYGESIEAAPESGLGMAINLIMIKKFLKGIEW